MATASAWKDVLNQLMALGRRVIINGDFNARSPLWLDTGSNTNGKALEEALSEIDGIMLNNDAPTRIADRATDTDSAIDLTFVSPDLTTSLGWKLLPLMGSDHRPVMTRIIRRRDKGQAKRRRSGVFRYTNRNDSIVSECRKQAKERRQQSTAKGTPDKPKWWNQEVEEAWDAKMKASKAYTQSKRARAEPSAVQEMRLNFNTATANFKNIAEQARQDVWDNFCTECDPSDLTIVSRFWNLAKQIKSKATGGVSGPQQITGENGEHLRTDQEKGEAFKARFVAQLQTGSEDKVNNAWVEADAHIANSTTAEPPVTFEEIQRTLGRIAKDSTPGPDGVKYSDLKNLSDEGKEKMVTLINKALMEGEVPTDWRDCNLAILPKPGKDHTKLKGYRVITMSNVWIKICEKVAARRLVRDLEDRECLTPEVGGGRPQRSTTSNIEATVHRAQQAMQRHQHTAIGLFDLEDAYNKVDVGILARKMREMGITDMIIRWVMATLKARTCCMKLGTWRSQAFQVSSGLPQGSPLSSVLFNIYTADIAPTLRTTSSISSSYVDDVIAEGTGRTQKEALAELQEASDKLAEWTVNNQMSIQPDKSNWMMASLGQQKEDLELTYANSVVKREKEVTGLGVVMDYRMTMNAHLSHLKIKASKGVAVLKYAAAQKITQASLFKLMKATVCSRSDYGLHLTQCASAKATDGLQRVENQAMRLVTGAVRGTSCEALRHWLNILSIRDRQVILGAKELLRVTSTPSHPLHHEVTQREDEQTTQRLVTVRSWVSHSRDSVESICPIENLKSDGWVDFVCNSFTTEVVGSRAWRERSGLMNNALIEELMEEKSPTTIIATDGSIRDDITAWGGAVWKGGKLIYEWSAGKHGRSSSYRSECEAMEDALTWLEGNSADDDRTIILTDSLSLVSKLQRKRIKKDWFPKLRTIRGHTEIVYIPGHAGIRYNERADRLAGNAVPFGELEMTADDVVGALITAAWEKAEHDEHTWSMERLREREVQRGEGAQITLRGNQRHVATQLMTGTMSTHGLQALLEMLGGRGPRYLPEPLLS